ncbi:hypothetical protein [Gimesia sp.]|uniref:hypothetical protein n=1 Tax=Gimesia sp. TaxID=2024833 RepID=UPI0032EFA65B
MTFPVPIFYSWIWPSLCRRCCWTSLSFACAAGAGYGGTVKFFVEIIELICGRGSGLFLLAIGFEHIGGFATAAVDFLPQHFGAFEFSFSLTVRTGDDDFWHL